MIYPKIQQVTKYVIMMLKAGVCFFCKHANYFGGLLKGDLLLNVPNLFNCLNFFSARRFAKLQKRYEASRLLKTVFPRDDRRFYKASDFFKPYFFSLR